VLPALLAALQIDCAKYPPWLLGHSDGASIALLYAARFSKLVAGVVALAPHIMVEDLTVAGIEQARQAYLNKGLRNRLAKYHDNPDSAFWRWNQIWLSPEFRSWSIVAEIKSIRCPLLAVQGSNDEYGSLKQIQGISTSLAQTEPLELENCGHSPQRDQPAQLIAAVRTFVGSHLRLQTLV
jgi:pimeloyl-ACP methyl ester carboxylesterase